MFLSFLCPCGSLHGASYSKSGVDPVPLTRKRAAVARYHGQHLARDPLPCASVCVFGRKGKSIHGNLYTYVGSKFVKHAKYRYVYVCGYAASGAQRRRRTSWSRTCMYMCAYMAAQTSLFSALCTHLNMRVSYMPNTHMPLPSHECMYACMHVYIHIRANSSVNDFCGND